MPNVEISDDAKLFLSLMLCLEKVDADHFEMAPVSTWFICELSEFGTLIPSDGLYCSADRHTDSKIMASYMEALIDEQEMCIHYWPVCVDCHVLMQTVHESRHN